MSLNNNLAPKPKENIIFIPGECYNTSPKFSQQFLNQFGAIITVQKELKHKNIIYSHNANPWFVNKNYDDLLIDKNSEKNKLISVITSNKTFTQGHKKRLEFVTALKDYFGDKLDVYGRGINDFNDKWDVLANYKYTIAIENDNVDYSYWMNYYLYQLFDKNKGTKYLNKAVNQINKMQSNLKDIALKEFSHTNHVELIVEEWEKVK